MLRRPIQHERSKLDRDANDEGFTLIELIAAMGIFSIFIVIFLTAVSGLMREASRTQVTSEATSSALIVFQNLDRQIRYADAINYPGPSLGSSGARYVEFRTPAASTRNNQTLCTQWRFLPSANRIESRTWRDIAGAVPSSWSTKLTAAISTTGANNPFGLIPASVGGSTMQQLTLKINAGTAGVAGSTQVETSFVARNSGLHSPSNAVNGSGQSATPVCSFGGYRP